MSTRNTTPRTRARRGAAAVEFAIVASLLVPVLLGIWEVGRLVQVQQLTHNAAREAGRQASTGTKTATEVRDAALNYLTRAGINTTGATVTVVNLTNPARSDPTNANQMDQFQITLALPFKNVRWIFADQITNTTELTATTDWYSMKDAPLTVSTSVPIE